MWGDEEPDSDAQHVRGALRPHGRLRSSACPVLDAQAGPETGVRMIHEGGSATHNGHGTMIAVESVVIQRNLGPNRFCGGQAPVTDYSQPNTYAPNPDWPACKALVENEYRRMLGVRKVIWVPTGVIEDNGTFRGAAGDAHPGAQSWTASRSRTRASTRSSPPTATPTSSCASWPPTRSCWRRRRCRGRRRERRPSSSSAGSQEQNHGGSSACTTSSRGRRRSPASRSRSSASRRPSSPSRCSRPGDGTYDYYAAYDRWEDGSTLPEVMLGVWPSSYVNYVPTNDLVLVSRFWKPGRSLESSAKDDAARSGPAGRSSPAARSCRCTSRT